MTIPQCRSIRGRTRPTAAHVYTIPVVRELPPRPVEKFDSRTW